VDTFLLGTLLPLLPWVLLKNILKWVSFGPFMTGGILNDITPLSDGEIWIAHGGANPSGLVVQRCGI
jgi:hypothetical protein